MAALKGSVKVCALVNLNSCVCACTSDLLSLPAQEEDGVWLSVLMYVDAVESVPLFLAISVTRCVTVLCVYLCLHVCVSATCLHYGLNLHTGKRQLHPLGWAETEVFCWVSVCLFEVFLFVSFACYLWSMFFKRNISIVCGPLV